MAKIVKTAEIVKTAKIAKTAKTTKTAKTVNSGKDKPLALLKKREGEQRFLVACTRLYKSLCRSVRPSVRPSHTLKC